MNTFAEGTYRRGAPDGRSRYAGADADGNPTGFATMPTAYAGIDPAYFPARCHYCSTVVNNLREKNTHMRNDHPA